MASKARVVIDVRSWDVLGGEREGEKEDFPSKGLPYLYVVVCGLRLNREKRPPVLARQLELAVSKIEAVNEAGSLVAASFLSA